MNMFKVDGNLSIDTSNIYISDAKSDLSICCMSDVEYFKLVVENKCERNKMYIVSSDSFNAFGEQVKNVACPTDGDDAATKSYVDAQVSQAKGISREEAERVAREVFKQGVKSILSALQHE